MKQRIENEPENTIAQAQSTLKGFKENQPLEVIQVLGEALYNFAHRFTVSANDWRLRKFILHTRGGVVDIVDSNQLGEDSRRTIAKGNYLYVAVAGGFNSESGISVIYKEDPIRMEIVGNTKDTSTLGNLFDMDIQEDLICTTSFYDNIFATLDISDPTNPVIKGTLTQTDFVDLQAVEIAGDYAYVTGDGLDSTNYTFSIVDISDPSNPSIVSTFSRADIGSSDDVKVYGDYAFVNTTDTLLSIDVSDKSNPVIVDTMTKSSTQTIDAPLAINTDDKLLYGKYINNGTENVDTIGGVDFTDPENLAFSGSTSDEFLASMIDVEYAEGYLWWAQSGQVVKLSAVFDPDLTLHDIYGNTRISQGQSLGSQISRVAVSGDFLYTNGGSPSAHGSVSAVQTEGGFDTLFSVRVEWRNTSGSYSDNDVYMEWYIDRDKSRDWQNRFGENTYAVYVIIKNRTADSITFEVEMYPLASSNLATVTVVQS